MHDPAGYLSAWGVFFLLVTFVICAACGTDLKSGFGQERNLYYGGPGHEWINEEPKPAGGTRELRSPGLSSQNHELHLEFCLEQPVERLLRDGIINRCGHHAGAGYPGTSTAFPRGRRVQT